MRMQPKQHSRNSEHAMVWTIRCSIPDSSKMFLFSKHVQTGSAVHPAFYPMGTRALSSGIKPAKRKADQSLPSSAEVKNEKRYSATPPVCLEGVHTDSFCTFEQTHECGCRQLE
jgi:hypothetical protein